MSALLLVGLVGAAVWAPPAGADTNRWDGPVDRLQEVEQALSELPGGMRSAALSAQLTFGCHPVPARCHWGVYDLQGEGGRGPRSLWLGPDAFATPERLRYVLTHELAHHVLRSVLDPVAAAGLSAGFVDEEHLADCVAAALGASGAGDSPYYRDGCPAELSAPAQQRLIELGLADAPAPPAAQAPPPPGPQDASPEAPGPAAPPEEADTSATPRAGVSSLAMVARAPGAFTPIRRTSSTPDRAAAAGGLHPHLLGLLAAAFVAALAHQARRGPRHRPPRAGAAAQLPLS